MAQATGFYVCANCADGTGRMMDAASAIFLCQTIASAGIVIDSLEMLFKRKSHTEDGEFSWTVFGKLLPIASGKNSAAIFRLLCSYRGVVFLLILQLICALLLIAAPAEKVFPFLVSCIFTIRVFFSLRTPFGRDGADDMYLVMFGALTFSYMSTDPFLKQACLWFLAAQLFLAYLASGVAKLISAEWRSGFAITGILSLKLCNRHALSRWIVRRQAVTLAIAWSIAAFESLSPVLVLTFPGTCLAVLAAGVVFHAMIAAVMGLNNFFWAFLAAYPAVLYVVGY